MIPALISATVALLVFALGQWLTWRKDHSRFLATKLEELYLRIDDFDRLIDFPPDHAADFASECVARGMDIQRELSRIEMLVLLYFPAAEGRFKQLSQCGSDFSDLLLVDLPRGMLDPSNESRIMSDVWNATKDLTSFLSTESAYLTGRIGH